MKVLMIILLLSLALAQRILTENSSASSQTTSATIDFTSSINNVDSLTKDVSKLFQISIKLQQSLMNIEESILSLPDKIRDYTLEHIKKNGIYLGNRWKIGEEGTNSYEALVFRDMTYTKAGYDRRYAFFQNQYRDY